LARNFPQLERVVRGFASRSRMQILSLLDGESELDLLTLARACGINYKTAAEHVRRLTVAGLVTKRPRGVHVYHSATSRGKKVLAFLRTLEQ
jgi:DNA-binding transcriptional ArsR family regulator